MLALILIGDILNAATYFLAVAGIIAAIAAIPASRARMPFIGICVLFFLVATILWGRSEISGRTQNPTLAETSPDPSTTSSSPSSSPQQSDSPASQPASPSDPPSAQSSVPSQSSPTSPPLSTNVPLLKPTNDPGFTPIWNGTLTVNDTGLTINDSGVYPASAQDWDLAYQSSNDSSNWLVNNQTSEDPAIFTYTGTGTPGPEWCRRAFEGDNGLTGGGTAEPGERDCYIDLKGVVGYLQVNSVGPDGPTVTAWFWNGPPP